MNSKWEKVKELYKNKYTRPLLFFGFYFVFFAVIIIAFSAIDTNDNNNDVEKKNIWDNITNNYEYLYEIKTTNDTVTLEGKHYGNKDLSTKKLNDSIISEIYNFYNDLYIKENNIWTSTNNYVLVDELFDNKLLDINYLKSLIVDAELIDSTTNFDESITDIYKYGDIDIEVISDNGKLKRIDINLPLYKMILQYKNINNVQDFVVEK